MSEQLIWDLSRGALTARALAVAADRGIADELADGPRRSDDDVTYRILRALPSDGVFEEVVGPGGESAGAKWLDLLMLVIAGGREREADEWRALLAAGGWEPVRLGPRLIEARRRPAASGDVSNENDRGTPCR